MNQQELERLEKFNVLKHAKENNLWIDDFYALGDLPLVGGHENRLVLDTENSIVYKSNNLVNCQNLVSELFKKIAMHNTIFPLTIYDIIGFTGIDYGSENVPYIEVVLKQKYIPKATQAKFDEIKFYMQSLGFTQTTPESYINENYLVFDLYPRNVLKDITGTIYVVDAEFKQLK